MKKRADIWLAGKLFFAQEGEKRSSRPAVRVALAGIIIGMAVMLLTVCIVVGFKETITEKMAGFGAHIQVVSFENNSTYEMQPIEINDSLLDVLRGFDNVASVQRFATKPGMLKTDDAFEGIIFKGTGYWEWFGQCLQEGHLPEAPNEVLISQDLARKLGLRTEDKLMAYFVDESVRVRKFTISGIYQTGFGEFDKLFILGQLSVVQQLNGWDSTEVSGAEILVKDMHRMESTADDIYFAVVNHLDESGHNVYYVQTLQQQNPQIFAWLDLLDMNVVVIIILMLLVSGFNIISGLIILILDNVQFIGTIKALGANNQLVRRIFINEAVLLIGKGVLWGDILGIGLALLQYTTHVIPLESATYYVNYVPIVFPWGWLIALNIGTIAVSLLTILSPSIIATRISPVQVMHFE